MHHVGTEELAHWEILGTMIFQSLRGASLADIDRAGLTGYYTMHNHGVFPCDPNGVPFTTAYIACTGDPITDINEDLAADATIMQEQLAIKTSNESQSERLSSPEYDCQLIYNQSTFQPSHG